MPVKHLGQKTFGTIDHNAIMAALAIEKVGVGSTAEVTDTNTFWEKMSDLPGNEWTDLGYIEGKTFNTVTYSGADLVTCRGDWPGKTWHYKNCVFDFRNVPLGDQDEAFSVVYGATATLENCVIIGAKKAILCGTGDDGDWGGRLTMRNCLILGCGRRTPEAQQGYTVTMDRCWIHNWGIEETFDVRAFATWAHDDAKITITNCIYTRNSGLGSNDARDIAEWIGWYTNEYGVLAAVGKDRYGLSGSLRAIEKIGGGTIIAEHNYRNQDDFVTGGDTCWSMTKNEADALIAALEAICPDLQPIVGKTLSQYWAAEV